MGEPEQVIDVERLVGELRERVERQRAAGAYADEPGLPVPVTAAAPAAVNGAPRPAPRVAFQPGDRYRSPRRIVGAIVSLLRRVALRLVHPALDDIARQTDAAAAVLNARAEWAEQAIAAEAAVREDVHRLVQHVERRVDDLSRLQVEAQERMGLTLDDVRQGHDELRERHDDLGRRHDDVRERQDDVRERQDDLIERQDALRERHDDVRQRHGERLERLETAARAFQTSSNETIQGISDHMRTLEASSNETIRGMRDHMRTLEASSNETIQGIGDHVRTLEARTGDIVENLSVVASEASALARHLEAFEGDAGGELTAARKHLRALDKRLREITARADAVAGRLRPFDPPPGYLLSDGDGRDVIGFRKDDPTAAGDDLYRRFEDVFRQDEATIRDRQRPYVELVRGSEPVLDAGCGRGEFLELLAEAGVRANGVDLDPGMVARCAEKALDVVQADALEYLEAQPDGSFGTIFSAQVIEHLSYDDLKRFIELAHAKLAPGGRFIAETVNPHSIVALRAFWLDPTHRSPIYPETALVLTELHGFASGEVIFPRGTGELEVDRGEQPDYAVVAKKA